MDINIHLITGDLIEFENNFYGLVLNVCGTQIISYYGGEYTGNGYDFSCSISYTPINVYRTENKQAFSSITHPKTFIEWCDIVWSNKPKVKELSVKEISDLLGYEVKVVK